MITVRLPAALRIAGTDTLALSEPIASIDALIDVLDVRLPGFRSQLNDALFNFAVNDELLLHHAAERALRDGDVVEIVPTLSGG